MTPHSTLKFVAVLLVTLWIALFFLRSPDDKLMSLWRADFEILKKSKILPLGFNQIREVEAHAHSEKLKTFLKTHKLSHFEKKPQGQYKLEIFLDETETGEIMIQYDLIDPKGNTVWELGRTLKIK